MIRTMLAASAVMILTLAGCAWRASPGIGLRGVDGVACAGGVEAPQTGLVEVVDEALRDRVRGVSGQGALCDAAVFEVTQPLRLFRVWDAAQGVRLGSWWALRPPAGSRDDYRAAYAVCPEWSALDAAVACTVKPGTRVAIGPGQSVTCSSVDYPKSWVNQVFVRHESPNVANVAASAFDACEDIPALR